MQPHNVRRARGQAIAFLLVVALSVAAVVIVLRPGGPLTPRLAGNSESSQILGYAPGSALARLELERDARATDAQTRGATTAAVQPGAPGTGDADVEPAAGGPPPAGAAAGGGGG